jgi:hypothetical protein
MYCYFLQTFRMSDFWKTQGASFSGAILFIVGVALIIAVIIIVNVLKKRSPTLSGTALPTAAAAAVPRRFSGFALYRLAGGAGLNRKQTKMLEYVFKNDGVTDPAHVINSPALLDQHFKQAYRSIERSSKTDEEAQEQFSMLFATRNQLEANAGGGLNSTRQVPDNSAALLTLDGETFPVKVITGKVEGLSLECPQDAAGTPVKPARGTKAAIAFFTKDSKGASFETHVLGVSDSREGPRLQLAHSNTFKRLAQRHFRRRQAVIAANFYFVYADDSGGQRKKLVLDKRRFTGTIMDLAIGGCSIKTSAPVSSGTRLKIEFILADSTPVAVLGHVLRTNKSGISTIMNIKFLKIPRKSMNAVNAYVYEYLEN